jgi:hypothetical protein
MANPHPTQFAWMAKEAVGSQLAATVVVGVVGLLCLALGIVDTSVILIVLGAVLILLSGMCSCEACGGPWSPAACSDSRTTSLRPRADGTRQRGLGSTPSAASRRSRAVTQAS